MQPKQKLEFHKRKLQNFNASAGWWDFEWKKKPYEYAHTHLWPFFPHLSLFWRALKLCAYEPNENENDSKKKHWKRQQRANVLWMRGCKKTQCCSFIKHNNKPFHRNNFIERNGKVLHWEPCLPSAAASIIVCILSIRDIGRDTIAMLLLLFAVVGLVWFGCHFVVTSSLNKQTNKQTKSQNLSTAVIVPFLSFAAKNHSFFLFNVAVIWPMLAMVVFFLHFFYSLGHFKWWPCFIFFLSNITKLKKNTSKHKTRIRFSTVCSCWICCALENNLFAAFWAIIMMTE